jgi:hypothetical protein
MYAPKERKLILTILSPLTKKVRKRGRFFNHKIIGGKFNG